MFAQLAQIARETKSRQVIVGTEGSDVLVSRGGASTMSAGLGDDTYVFKRESDTLVTVDDGALLSHNVYISGGGHDTLFFSDINLSDLFYERKGNDLMLAHVDDAKTLERGVLIHGFYGESAPARGMVDLDATDLTTDTPSQNRIESIFTADFKMFDLGLL